MSSIHYLQQFDQAQLFRFFVDGRFHEKYNGWLGYEAGERGSVQAMLNGFAFMLDHFSLSKGLRCTYLLALHKICMNNVATKNKKSSPGDLRYLNSGMPFFAKTTTLENLKEIFELRKGDGTALFNSASYGKTTEQLDPETIYQIIQSEGKINYRNWYPNLDNQTTSALNKTATLHEFYHAKHYIQMLFVSKMEEIVARYNSNIKTAQKKEEILTIIARVVRELELLHPFPDGNCRTFAGVMLNQMLLYHGFYPAIIENPNLDGEYSLAQWTNEIKKGMENTKILLQNPHARLFNYAITDAKKEDVANFLTMASTLIEKIENYQEIHLTPSKLQHYTGGYWLNADLGQRFTGVGTYNTYRKGNIYFALAITDWQKEKKNIAAELRRIIKKGIVALVLEDKSHAKDLLLPILMVENLSTAFKQAAIATRQATDCTTVLITGTEGKTGAKVQLHQLLNQQTKAHAVRNSANTEIPVLRSLITIGNHDKVEITEVSVGSDEDYRVERTKMVNPDICLFTNIGPNHMDMHKTMENVLDAKSSVVEGLKENGVCIVNADNSYYQALVSAIKKRKPAVKMLTYGTDKDNTACLVNRSFDAQRLGWQVNAKIKGLKVDYFLPLLQQHAPLMSVAVLLTLQETGFKVAQAANDYQKIQPYETMGQLLTLRKEKGEVLFYDQSRRGGMQGMRSAFQDIKNIPCTGKIVALVGGISVKKDSPWTKKAHSELAELINNNPNIKRLYTTGNFMGYVHEHLHDPAIFIQHSEDLDELTAALMAAVQPGDLLFVIGSAYLYLGKLAEKIINWQDTDDNKQPLEAMRLSELAQLKYKMLLIFSDIAQGQTTQASCTQHELSQKNYKKWQLQYKNYNTLRTQLLMGFFKSLDKHLAANKNNRLTCINTRISESGYARSLYSYDHCNDWFHNVDKLKNKPGKQLIGSFFDFGHKQYLLHIQVATKNLHIGLIKYQIHDKKYRILKISRQDHQTIHQQFSDAVALQWRPWGFQWSSIDCGPFYQVTDSKIFSAMINFRSSAIFAHKCQPFLDALQ